MQFIKVCFIHLVFHFINLYFTNFIIFHFLPFASLHYKNTTNLHFLSTFWHLRKRYCKYRLDEFYKNYKKNSKYVLCLISFNFRANKRGFIYLDSVSTGAWTNNLEYQEYFFLFYWVRKEIFLLYGI